MREIDEALEEEFEEERDLVEDLWTDLMAIWEDSDPEWALSKVAGSIDDHWDEFSPQERQDFDDAIRDFGRELRRQGYYSID